MADQKQDLEQVKKAEGTEGGGPAPASEGDGKQPTSSPFQQVMASIPEPEKTPEAKAEAEAKTVADKKVIDEAAAKVAAETGAKKPEGDAETRARDFQAKFDTATKELDAAKAIVAEWEKDPINTLKKRRPEVLQNLEAATDLDGFVAKWQKTTLMEELKKKFPEKVVDDWSFDAAEAYTAGTPSYQYRVMTEEKRNQISSSLQTQRQREEEIVAKYATQRDADIKFIKETYNYDDERMKQVLTTFDTIHQEVAAGKQPAEKHPFALRNLIRGMFFDDLVKIHQEKAVTAAVAELTNRYKEKGYVLEEVKLTDAGSVKAEPGSPADKSKKKLSPFFEQMERVTAQT